MNHIQAIATLALLAVSASGCGKKQKDHEAFLQIDGSFQTYVNTFEQTASSEGGAITINDLILNFGSTPSINETGICEWAEDETPRITINKRIWDTLTEYDRQEVIFHELGHCILRRIHQGGEVTAYGGGMNIPASVMYPYRISGTIYRDNIVHYHDELFDGAKRNQF